MELQRDTAADLHRAALLVGDIAVEHNASPWQGDVPQGQRGLAWSNVPYTGYRWRVVNRLGVVEAAGFILISGDP